MSLQDKDIFYMQQALQLAQNAYDAGEVPIGAIVIDQFGEIIGSGYNQTELYRCQDQHAEMCAIRQACVRRNDWRLDGCTLYVTLEPCIMCMGCIVLSRIERLVYAARSPLFGFSTHQTGKNQEGGCELFSHEDVYALYAKSIKNITVGTCSEEAKHMLKNFFRERRK